ncbi:protein regulator of cytokinesis 1 [Rhipicephalus microplus]|uniref:protein regulator of cytokinesis 1 n=1 Tax=Rhipicephalus microplus TaxID=6941 RepID=UPI003F6ABF99
MSFYNIYEDRNPTDTTSVPSDRTYPEISGICVNIRICGFVEVGQDRCEKAEEICTMVTRKLQLLMSVWADLGFEYEPTRSRFERTKSHIETLLNQMIDSEVEMKETLLKKIAQLKDHLHQLCRELSIPLPEFTASLSILEQENTVRKDLEHLKEKKRDRERAQKKLKKKEAELCAKLGAHCLSTCSVSVPSEKNLQEMKLWIQGLEREKVIVCYHSGIEKIA